MAWIVFGSAAALVIVLAAVFARQFVVPEGHAGLLYRNGRLVEALSAGVHTRFGLRMRVERVDTRLQSFEVAGQEVLTSDNVSVKLSVVADCRVRDATRAARESAYWGHDFYRALQLALRDAVDRRTFDEVLRARNEIGAETSAAVAPIMATIGVEVARVAVRDIMLSADLRRAFAEAVRLREEGRAALEKARSETAALRSLANAARMLKDNPDLLQVRTLQAMEAVGAGAGNTVVFGTPFALAGDAQRGRTAQNGGRHESDGGDQ